MQEETQVPSSPVMAATAVEATAPSVTEQVPAVPTQTVEFQGFWIRLAANFIDGFIIGLVYFIVFFGLGFGGVTFFGRDSGWIFILVYPILFLLIFAYQWGMLLKFDGQTLGKKLVGIKVISADGNKLTLGQVILRELLGKIVSGIFFDLGYIWAAFDPQKQAWHDKIAKTYVIKR